MYSITLTNKILRFHQKVIENKRTERKVRRRPIKLAQILNDLPHHEQIYIINELQTLATHLKGNRKPRKS